MADNYLENKMEEHRRGAAAPVRRYSPTGQLRGTLTLKFPVRRVMVAGNSTPLHAAAVEALSSAGCQTAFCDTDAGRGTELARRTASRFYPVKTLNAADVSEAINSYADLRGDIDVVIVSVTEAEAVASALGCIRRRAAAPNPYGGRFIVIGDAALYDLSAVAGIIEPLGMTVTGVTGGCDAGDFRSLMPLLLLDGGRLLHRHIL